MDMITFDKGNDRFNFRTAGVVIHGNRVLVHKAKGDDFWALPGGRVEFGESSETAIVRGMEEETGVLFRVVRPLWILENFFDHLEKKYHEVSLIFLLHCLDERSLLKRGDEFAGLEDSGAELIFKWLQTGMLGHTPLFPSFLRKDLDDLPASIQYRVHTDRNTV
jgi:ADP-ribose pyrophosphatase YjhB (NUDIX family)